jgi:hypothetical protein
MFDSQPPMAINPAVHSYGFIIRNGILDRLKTVPTFSTIKTFATNKMIGPVQAVNLPYLAVYFMRERYLTDGAWNSGEPHFKNRVELGISVMISCSDTAVAEDNLDIAHWAIMNYLTRQDWWHFKMPDPFPDVQIEGIEGGEWKPNFGQMNKQESMWAEMAMQLFIRHGTSFPPVVTDIFETMHVEIAPKWPYDPGAYVPPFIQQYDVSENVPTPTPYEEKK